MEVMTVSIVERLRSDPKVYGVIFASRKLRYFNGIAVNDHFKMIAKNIVGDMENRLLEAVVEFITAPMIIDSFASHTQRREWREGFSNEDPELYKLIKSDRLRVNNISKIVYALEMHEEFNIQDPFWMEDSEDFLNDIKSFNDKNLNEKIRITVKLTYLSRSFYERVVVNL